MKRIIGIGLTTVALAGCGGSSGNSSSAAVASKTKFCADNAKLDKATASVSSLDGLLKSLKANQSTIDDFGRVAPGAIKAQALVLVSESDAAIKANSATGIDAKKFGTAGKAVDTYCGESTTT
jgi:hypothetical protein